MNPSSPALPLSYHSNLYGVNQMPPVAMPIRKIIDTTPSTYLSNLDNFPKDILSSKIFSQLYKHFYPKIMSPSKYIIHHVDDSEKSKDMSLFSMLNPFECESDESEEGGEDYSDFIDSSEFLKKRKFKYLKKKKKKKKLKKKKLLIKFLIVFLIFIALKVLFEKFYYFFPTIFPSTAREELLDEMDSLFEEGLESDRASDWNKAQQLGEKHRAVFAPNYEETRIDVRIPIRRKILTDPSTSDL